MKYITDIYSDKAFHWLQFIKHNNLGFLRLDALSMPPYKVDQDNSEDSRECYCDINDQIIAIFGMDESFEEQQNKKEEVAKMKLDFIINGDKSLRTAWRIKELDIESTHNQTSVLGSLERDLAVVSRSVGSGIIDIKKYSIHQYLVAKNTINNGG
jgi:hypothetical protein